MKEEFERFVREADRLLGIAAALSEYSGLTEAEMYIFRLGFLAGHQQASAKQEVSDKYLIGAIREKVTDEPEINSQALARWVIGLIEGAERPPLTAD